MVLESRPTSDWGLIMTVPAVLFLRSLLAHVQQGARWLGSLRSAVAPGYCSFRLVLIDQSSTLEKGGAIYYLINTLYPPPPLCLPACLPLSLSLWVCQLGGGGGKGATICTDLCTFVFVCVCVCVCVVRCGTFVQLFCACESVTDSDKLTETDTETSVHRHQSTPALT